LQAKTICHVFAKPMNGLETAERKYPIKATGFRCCNLSDSHPENPCNYILRRLGDTFDDTNNTSVAFRYCVK
jgi:hypothetical protein